MLFETKKYGARDIKIVPFILKLNRLDLVMQTIAKIKSKSVRITDTDLTQEVLTLDSRKLAKKFGILVGNERVKSADLVNKMIQGSIESTDKNLNLCLNMDEQLFNNYAKSVQELKELMALNYLRAACFLNIYKDVMRRARPYYF